jgi:hypothetical protein
MTECLKNAFYDCRSFSTRLVKSSTVIDRRYSLTRLPRTFRATRADFYDTLLVMPLNRNDSDPLEARRRQLAEQERMLSEQRRRLTEELHSTGESPSGLAKPVEPLVWRMEEDGQPDRIAEPTPARKRNLARQRRRDMILVFFLIVLFLIVVGIVLWVAYTHNAAPSNGT